LLGHPTGGCLSDILCVTLPNGWRLGLSYQRYHEADTGLCFEGVGIPPDITLDHPADAAGVGNARDAWLDEAVQALAKKERRASWPRGKSAAAACAFFGVSVFDFERGISVACRG
jgi:C-terminal processing protease CtpA/Prc